MGRFVRRANTAGLLAAGLLTIATGVALADDQAGAPAPIDDFDRAWQLVNEAHWDPAYLEQIGWDNIRQTYRVRAEAADSLNDVRVIITEMLGELKQSHFSVIPSEVSNREFDGPEAAWADFDAGEAEVSEAEFEAAPEGERSAGAATTGVQVRVINSALVIVSVDPGSPAATLGIEPGWVITRIGDTEVSRLINALASGMEPKEVSMYAWQVFDEDLRGREGSRVRLGMLDHDNNAVRRIVARADSGAEMFKFGNLPAMSTELDWWWLDTASLGMKSDKRIGVIRFNIWMIPIRPQFERAMWELRDADGIIIDVRGNLGGIGGMAPALTGFFVDDRASMGSTKMRGNEINITAQPIQPTSRGDRYTPYAGPVALLTDNVSASTSEIFAAGLQAIDRAAVFGDTTAGAALPALMSPLPSGDILLHAMADYIAADGERPEGGGVIPDLRVPLTRGDLSNGIDAPMRAASAWIAGGGQPFRRQHADEHSADDHANEN